MATLEISTQLLESLKGLANLEGIPVNQLAEGVLARYVGTWEEEPNLELDEVIASLKKSEVERAAGIEVSEEEIDDAVAELFTQLNKASTNESSI